MTAFAPWEGLTAMDDRRVARIFMASSRVLKEERAAFDGVVDAVSRVPHINRTFRLQPIRWETHAYGAAATEINRSIRESVDFTDSECVVVACDDRIGPGTRDEYDEALRLLRQHGRPQVFVYIKDRVDTVPEVEAFREEALTQGVVVKGYPSTNLWLEMLKRDLTQHFAKRHTGEGEEPVRLRRQFLASAWISASSALGIIGLCRLVRPPEGLSQPIALAILASPLMLVGLSAWVQWNYDRLLASLREAWRSPRWVDDASYRPFRGLVPRFALPRPMSLSLPRIGLVGALGLALAFFSGVVGIYNCVFEQMLRWEYAASWKTVAEARVEPLRRRPEWPSHAHRMEGLDRTTPFATLTAGGAALTSRFAIRAWQMRSPPRAGMKRARCCTSTHKVVSPNQSSLRSGTASGQRSGSPCGRFSAQPPCCGLWP